LCAFIFLLSLNCRYIDSAGLSGPLPSSFSRLTRMKTLYAYKNMFLLKILFHATKILFVFLFIFSWASDNDFTGQIPDYIGTGEKQVDS
jgi:hypothetical protein